MVLARKLVRGYRIDLVPDGACERGVASKEEGASKTASGPVYAA
jgi:hypothetical protein